jgi:transposase
MLNMICSGDGGVPLFMQLGDGNESDKKVFPQIGSSGFAVKDV